MPQQNGGQLKKISLAAQSNQSNSNANVTFDANFNVVIDMARVKWPSEDSIALKSEPNQQGKCIINMKYASNQSVQLAGQSDKGHQSSDEDHESELESAQLS